MSTHDDALAYLNEMVQQRGYVLEFHKGMAAADFPTLQAFNEMLDHVYLSQRTLDRKTKELIFVSTLTVMRSGKGHIQSHIHAALKAGATPQEILEALEITIPEAGVVAFQAGFEAWREVVNLQGLEPTIQGFEGGSGTK